MAVRVPDFSELGFNDPRSAGQLPNYPANDPVAEGMDAFGKGVQKAGHALEDIGAIQQNARDKLNEAVATTDLFNRLTPLHSQIAKETDPEKLSQLQSQYTSILQTSAGAIDNPYRRQLWLANHAKTIAQANADADTRSTVLYRGRSIADIHTQIDTATRNAASSDDPMALPNANMAVGNLLEWGEKSGALTPEQAYTLRKQSQKGLVEGTALRLIDQGKADEAKAFLENNRADIDAITYGNLQLRASGKGRKLNTDSAALESLGLPTTNSGIGKLPSVPAGLPAISSNAVNSTLPPEARALLDTIAGPESRGVYDVRYTPSGGAKFSGFGDHPRISESGPEGQSTAAGRYQIVATTFDKVAPQIGVTDFRPESQDAVAWQIARNAYKQQTGDDLLGALREGKLAEVQSALRSSRQWDTANMGAYGANLAKYQQVATGVQSIPTDTSTATPQTNVPMAPQSRTGLPSLTDAYLNILRNPRVKTDQDVRDAFSTATAVHNAMEADAARAERIKTQAEQQQMRTAENEIYADVYGPNPKVTASQIAVDPRFNINPERRKQMIELINNPPGSDVPAAQSHQAALSMIERVRLPDGDPNKITDVGQIYDSMRLLNRADFEFVRKEFDNIRTPGGEVFNKRKGDFIKAIEPQIDKSNPLVGKIDETGKEQLYRFNWLLDQRVDEYRKAGKNPLDLLDPAKPDYMGKPEAVAPYQKSISDSVEEAVKSITRGTPQAEPEMAKRLYSNQPGSQQSGSGVLFPLPPPPALAVPPRQPGETPNDYLQRVR